MGYEATLPPRADVAKCHPLEPCPMQAVCLRYLRPAAQHQWYSMFENWGTELCSGFEPVADWESS